MTYFCLFKLHFQENSTEPAAQLTNLTTHFCSLSYDFAFYLKVELEKGFQTLGQSFRSFFLKWLQAEYASKLITENP